MLDKSNVRKQFLTLATLTTLMVGGFQNTYALNPIEVPKTPLKGSTIFNQNDSTNASFDALAAAAGVAHDILELGISVKTADDITVKCGSTVIIGALHFGDNSGVVQDFSKTDFSCDVNEALVITKGIATTDVTVWGKRRDK